MRAGFLLSLNLTLLDSCEKIDKMIEANSMECGDLEMLSEEIIDSIEAQEDY